ncbi:MAG TPA: RNA polymerase sigma factor [Gemmataceae bacterium]|jgi:RNA polymerase sigma-70 factor (ECF subfamily)|nr:RNA polymerase sigma factor [Gemmataceae bacterium]
MRPGTTTTPPPRDELLAALAADGDAAALDELFRRFREPAYRVAYRLLGSTEDALDAVQDGFIKALTHLRSFEKRSSFKTWLLRIVSNAALDLGRQRRRRDELNQAAIQRTALAGGTTPDHLDPAREAEESDLRRSLTMALQQLPEAQRRTFVLHVDGGLSYREVASAMEISIGTVMSRLYYARQKLKEMLAERVSQ